MDTGGELTDFGDVNGSIALRILPGHTSYTAYINTHWTTLVGMIGALAIVAVEIKLVREQLRLIEKRLEVLEEHYANLKGVTKEIDEIREEVHAILKHVGIERKIAA